MPNQPTGLNDAIDVSAKLRQQLRIERRPRLWVHQSPKHTKFRVKACFELTELGLWKVANFSKSVHVFSDRWHRFEAGESLTTRLWQTIRHSDNLFHANCYTKLGAGQSNLNAR